jgi:hypothetical protein
MQFFNSIKKFPSILTLILLMWSIWWAPNNACKWQMGFNLAFKGLNQTVTQLLTFKICVTSCFKTYISSDFRVFNYECTLCLLAVGRLPEMHRFWRKLNITWSRNDIKNIIASRQMPLFIRIRGLNCQLNRCDSGDGWIFICRSWIALMLFFPLQITRTTLKRELVSVN